MKLVIAGTGYVGLVAGACLADVGHSVTCIDNDVAKITRLQQGRIDIYEPGLGVLVESGLKSGHLAFASNLCDAIPGVAAIFIAVGTPSLADGSTDLGSVFTIAESIGAHLDHPALVIVKSTVPAGTCHRVKDIINSLLHERKQRFTVSVVSNPEFLKEGSSIGDFTRPDRIIVGCDDPGHLDLLHQIYAPYNRKKDKIISMDVLSAELTKYAANAMLATKISFMNEMARIAESVGADIEHVRLGMGSDPRIGYDFIYAGCGYGGSCFPKDIRSLVSTATQHGQPADVLRAVEMVNVRQKNILFARLQEFFKGNLSGKTIALWGLAFKPNTNDVREAPSRVLMEAAWSAGARIQAYDPVAGPEISRIYTSRTCGQRPDLVLCADKNSALKDADALVICTEWKEFRVPDCDAMKRLLRHPVVIDGRNLYEPEHMLANGLAYYGVGRGVSCRP